MIRKRMTPEMTGQSQMQKHIKIHHRFKFRHRSNLLLLNNPQLPVPKSLIFKLVQLHQVSLRQREELREEEVVHGAVDTVVEEEVEAQAKSKMQSHRQQYPQQGEGADHAGVQGAHVVRQEDVVHQQRQGEVEVLWQRKSHPQMKLQQHNQGEQDEEEVDHGDVQGEEEGAEEGAEEEQQGLSFPRMVPLVCIFLHNSIFQTRRTVANCCNGI